MSTGTAAPIARQILERRWNLSRQRPLVEQRRAPYFAALELWGLQENPLPHFLPVDVQKDWSEFVAIS